MKQPKPRPTDVILWPLTGVQSVDPLQGGLGFLDPTPEGVIHPAADFNAGNGANADCGFPVLAADTGPIVYRGYHVTASGRGFGNHSWQLIPRTGDFLHYCHMATAVLGEGVPVERGHVLGLCGRTAGWPNCHLHFEVWNGANGPPPSWDYWPVGKDRAWIESHYHDPLAWLIYRSALDDEPQENPDVIAELQTQVAALSAQVGEVSADRDLYAAALDSCNRVKSEIELIARGAYHKVKRGKSFRYVQVSDADILDAVARAQ